ncbi:MAG: CHRD domain-containing protein [Usitatibacter sp.]
MDAISRVPQRSLLALVALVGAILAGCARMEAVPPGPSHLTLSGSQEVPPVATSASATGNFKVSADKSVSGSITTTGIVPTAAHIHMAAAGSNGPVIIPLTKYENTFSVPAGARLNDEQYAAYKAGKLYVNVHSANYKAGEIRAQLVP